MESIEKTSEEICITYKRCLDNICDCGACDVNNRNYAIFKNKKWLPADKSVLITDVKKLIQEIEQVENG